MSETLILIYAEIKLRNILELWMWLIGYLKIQLTHVTTSD